MREWTPIYRLPWYYWVPIDVYECVIGLALGVFSMGVLAVAVGRGAGLIPPDAVLELGWYELLIGIAVAIFLTWVTFWSTLTGFLDLVFPARSFEGPLHRLERRHHRGKLGGFHVWQLTSGDQTWDIPCADTPADFAEKLKSGSKVRITYRRGTSLVTGVCILDSEPNV